MSDLGEEEIINTIRKNIKNSKGQIANCNIYDLAAIIDLYYKEKEKNKALEIQLLEKDLHIDGLKENRRIAIEEIQEEYYVSKDKIREKIKELENLLKNTTMQPQIYTYEIDLLKRLLEE